MHALHQLRPFFVALAAVAATADAAAFLRALSLSHRPQLPFVQDVAVKMKSLKASSLATDLHRRKRGPIPQRKRWRTQNFRQCVGKE